MILLPAAYLPSTRYFAALLRGEAVVDVGEHYIKRSERNRARIMTADGVIELSAQVAHANRPRQAMHTMRLDYSKRWQHQHWGALVAAYKAAPFFEHYAPLIEPFYHREWERLIDLNLALTEQLCRAVGIAPPPVSYDYLTATKEDLDLRPKKEGPTLHVEPYIQVFADRQPFVANLSFVDLLFAEGPNSVSVLKRCRFE